ncbi:putative transcriptional regulator [Streptomyces kronopolitis]|uniref:Transcriptional regulator n=1 Tax=Streptomyces kronopolitis TaxID=1612435 RepID=A0ABQ2JBN6_9ACTN|nr:helix-turn-helix domain-containing protein [Streptomyces kronopolitis]GGN43751.1 putative transcriptional regulator [Streptomyces kronopolitis]
MPQPSASPTGAPEPDEDIRENIHEGIRAQVVRMAARVEPRINHLARLAVERQRAEVPGFDRLPDDMQDLEIASAARHTFRGFLRGVQGLADTDAEVLRERATQRAAEGVHLTGLLRAYHVGAEVVADALSAAARPGEEAALLWLTRRLFTTVNCLAEQATEAYLLGLAGRQAAGRELAAALLRGDAPQEVAARCGLPLEPGYLVLSVRAPVAQEPVAARRLLHQVLIRLAPAADGRALSLPNEQGGHVLLPLGTPHADLVRHLSTGLSRPVIAGAALAATPEDVPAAAEQAHRIAAIARTPGVYRLQDVLLDYHLAGSRDSATELAALLHPLEAHAGLIEAVAAYLDCDLDRRRTARALSVHPNTVDNRLARAAQLTGLDPHTTHGVQLFGAALTLRRLAEVPAAPG